MEANNNPKENSTVSQFFNKKKLKLGGEENKIPIPINNKDINNDANNPQNTKEKMQFLFPNLPPEEINNVLERAEYNIEKAIILIKELKEQKDKKDNLNKDNVINPKKKKGIIKRNYNCMIEKEKEFLKNQIEPNVCQNTNKTNTLNNTSNNININENKGDDDISTNPNIRNNNINMNNSNNNNEKENNINDEKIKDINSNNNDNNVETINNNIHIDEGKRNLINRQIQYLIVKFSEMTDISQLKNLLKEIGFPVNNDNKENKENNDESENNKLIEKLNEKVKINKEEKKFIINQYNKHNSICKLIKQKEEKIDELTSSLVNLIDAESEQKMREEEYKNELTEYIKLLYNDNSFNFPREDY